MNDNEGLVDSAGNNVPRDMIPHPHFKVLILNLKSVFCYLPSKVHLKTSEDSSRLWRFKIRRQVFYVESHMLV